MHFSEVFVFVVMHDSEEVYLNQPGSLVAQLFGAATTLGNNKTTEKNNNPKQ